MPKAKLKSFFEGHRRKAFLKSWTHLKTTAGESRIKLELRVPLLNESYQGMNPEISDVFTVMAKDSSSVGTTKLNCELEGMTLECFTTSDTKSSKKPNVSSTGVKMLKLALEPIGEGEKRGIDLNVTAYVPASEQLRDWAWGTLHNEFGLEAAYSQSEMDYDGAEEEEEPEEEEEEESEAALVQ